jgi:hypothetical protein
LIATICNSVTDIADVVILGKVVLVAMKQVVNTIIQARTHDMVTKLVPTTVKSFYLTAVDSAIFFKTTFGGVGK